MTVTESTSSVSVPDHIARQVVLPEGHREDEPLFAAYQWLRENAPLAKVHVEGYDPLWLVAKHADIMEIEKQPAVFPSGGGAKPGSHNPILQNQAGDAFTMSLTGGSLRILETVTYLDPPEHTMVRNIAAEWFRPASLKKWEDRIRELAREAIATRLHPGPNDLDIVGDFALSFPLHVIMTLFGVPAEDEPRMMALTQEFFGTTDPEVQRADVTPLSPEAAAQQWSAAIRDFYAFFDALVEARRAEPRDDLASIIANARRPQAAALVAALADPDRGWDAIVIGEYERAFYGGQYASMAPLFEHYGIQLWTPEVGGRIDFHADDHEETMLALGLQSKREIARTRIRVRTAMATQTREQGRYLGGRPPYGYRLADAGPHPNKVHASWGRRAHRLEPDPDTAPVVTWMFAQRLAGHSAARITRALNDAGIPCPSATDPGRNPHRTGTAWTLRTVAAILANPRYTGRQVWNRQRTDHDLVDPANTGLGHRQVQRWNLPAGWVISARPAHPAIISEADYIAAQDATAPRGPAGPPTRRYLLAGLLACGRCGRRLESAWSNGKPSYRCRHGYTSAVGSSPNRPPNLYVREDQILPRLAALAILQSKGSHPPRGRKLASAQVTAPAQAAELIDRLRAADVTLIYDPATRALRTDTKDSLAVTVG